MPLVCPAEQICQTPKLNVKTNGDLVLAIEQSLTALELCQLKEQALVQCIDSFNQQNQQKETNHD